MNMKLTISLSRAEDGSEDWEGVAESTGFFQISVSGAYPISLIANGKQILNYAIEEAAKKVQGEGNSWIKTICADAHPQIR